MNTFKLEVGYRVSYNGFRCHNMGTVVGIDAYSKLKDKHVIKRWTSYSISSAPDISMDDQMKLGKRWWITWDGIHMREWIAVRDNEIDWSGKIIEDMTGEISVDFDGDAGFSTSKGQLLVFQDSNDSEVWHACEEFFNELNEKETFYFSSKPILDLTNLTIDNSAKTLKSNSYEK